MPLPRLMTAARRTSPYHPDPPRAATAAANRAASGVMVAAAIASIAIPLRSRVHVGISFQPRAAVAAANRAASGVSVSSAQSIAILLRSRIHAGISFQPRAAVAAVVTRAGATNPKVISLARDIRSIGRGSSEFIYPAKYVFVIPGTVEIEVSDSGVGTDGASKQNSQFISGAECVEMPTSTATEPVCIEGLI